VTLSKSARECAFGLPNRPLSKQDLDRALKKAHTLFKKNEDRARRSIANTLFLDVVFSPKLIPVPKWHNAKKYPNSRVPHGSKWEQSPVWKTAPPGAYKKANRLAMLFGNIAKFGHRANISHDLMRLSINVWSMSLRHFSGLCRRIEARCVSIATVSGETNYMPEPALRRALSANPNSSELEKVARSHLRKMTSSKYGVNHRPSCLGGAELLLSVLKRKKWQCATDGSQI